MRPYTGTLDSVGNTKTRPGTKRFQEWMVFCFQMRNLGLFADRTVRGSAGLSVHKTGRAADLGGTADQVRQAIAFLYDRRNFLEIEAIHDYRGLWIPSKGFGAAYRCNRDTGGLLSGWKVYEKNTIGPGGLWVHYEVSPRIAQEPTLVDDLFTRILENRAD